MMINSYNTLRNKYIVDGYKQAYQYITQLQSEYNLSQTLLTNFYCYIIIQAQFKSEQILTILENCIQSQDCTGSIRALTLYHIGSVYFKKKQFQKCKNVCQQILQQFIGLYYSIETRLERSEEQNKLSQQLQQILYYVFLVLAYINRKEDKSKQVHVYLEAGKRILKDRKDVMYLTKTSFSKKSLGTEESNNLDSF